MKLLNKALPTLLLLTVASAAVVLSACSEPAPEPSALADEAYAILDALTTQYSPRDAGSVQETRAALHLRDRLDDIGYDTSIEQFGTSYTHDSTYMFYADPPLESGEGGASLDPIRPHLHDGPPVSPPGGYTTGLVTPFGDLSLSDILNRELEGRIALIDLAPITDDGLITPDPMAMYELIQRAEKAGAVGAILLVDQDDATVAAFVEATRTSATTYIDNTFRASSGTPVVSIGTGKGNALLELIDRGDVTASIKVDMTQGSLWNVVANKSGPAENPRRRVILGAHYDTLANSQGASDNGSGVAALLTVARHIAERDYPFDIQIVLFGAQKTGMLGSKQYVETMSREELDDTITMLNFDALGAGSSLTASGDSDLTSDAIEVGKELGAPITLAAGGKETSDHAPFEEAGIPVLFMSSNDTSRINSPEDTIEHINPDLLGYAAEIAIAMLDQLANEPR